jgi:MFS family permease
MKGSDYNIAVSVFFIPYILCEIPSNMLLAKFRRPSLYIGIIVTCWGSIVALTGCVGSFAGLCVTRFLVGTFEAGFFPGAVWLISRKSQSLRGLLFSVPDTPIPTLSKLRIEGLYYSSDI